MDSEPLVQTILVVEDEEAISDFIAWLLEQETPYKALHAADAIQALEVVSSIKPNLFILDYRLPGIDGLELSDRLHAIEGLEKVPTLMISADPPSLNEVRKRHITIFHKPFDLDLLLKAIYKLLPNLEG